MTWIRLSVLACIALQLNAQSTPNQPQVSTKGGSLVFTSGDNGDISFFPGTGRSLFLNGAEIKSAADLKGEKGDSGINGTIGATGAKGDTGGVGAVGAKGDTGSQGLKGDAGQNGVAGPKGDAGADGKDGTDGQDGAKGEKGAAGSNGVAGNKGDKGENGLSGKDGIAGPPGPAGASGCTTLLLPSCPYWLNANQRMMQANTPNQVLRLSTGGMSKYYHPLFEASFICRLEGLTTKTVVVTAPASLVAVSDSVTGNAYYAVDCPIPSWSLKPSAGGAVSVQETANISLWFQGSTEIAFVGQDGSNQVQFVTGWFNTTTLSDGSVQIQGVGFNTSATFLCQFSNTSPLGVTLHVNATVQFAASSNLIKCNPPHWNFTSDSRISVVTTVKIFEEDHKTKAVVHEVPFRGTPKVDDTYTYYRCRDGVINGVETDVDCGGLCPNLCPSGGKCKVNSDCSAGTCLKGVCGARGQSQAYPADSCQVLKYNSSGIAWIKWSGASGGAVQTYCLLDKSIDGGGWAMVWKHSYFEVNKAKLNDMRSYSSFYQPCLGIPTSTGVWCNIPNKIQTGYTEQMVTAYHNGRLVYAYKANINSQLGKSNSGVFLSSTRKVFDICRYSNGVRPSYSSNSAATFGITFDKTSPTDFNSNCDTDWSNYATDCRWENCGLPSSISTKVNHVQMTIIIYVR